MVCSQDIVQIALPQMAIVHARGHGQWTFSFRRDVELVTNQDGSSGWDRIVISNGVDCPDLVIVYEVAGDIYRPIGEAVRPPVERSVRLQKAAMIDLFPVCLGDCELDPCLI